MSRFINKDSVASINELEFNIDQFKVIEFIHDRRCGYVFNGEGCKCMDIYKDIFDELLSLPSIYRKEIFNHVNYSDGGICHECYDSRCLKRDSTSNKNIIKHDLATRPKPFITKCHFCGCEVRLQKDQTEGKAVACFEHSHKFMEALE